MNKIRVKFLSRLKEEQWLRCFPKNVPAWGNCEFIFDTEATDFDWLVVYEDLPAIQGEYKPIRREKLSCPQSNTMLLTTEPSTIKAYGSRYTNQFGWVLTSQPDWALPHPNRIFTQQAMHWHYGLNYGEYYGCDGEDIPFDKMVENPPLNKTKDLATVCSAKKQKHTLHNMRYRFTQELKKKIPEMDIFGRGVREMLDKAESLDDYRYHLAIENFIGPHHLTEKLTDVFLGGALPFYCGCPNAADYFPEESFIPLDLNDPDGAAEIIQKAIRDDEYSKRLPFIMEARNRALYQHGVFSIVAREVEAKNRENKEEDRGGEICSRWLLLKESPAYALRFIYEKYRLRFLHSIKPKM